MKVIDKVLLTIMIIVGIFTSLCILAVAWHAVPASFLNDWIYNFYHDFTNTWILTGISLIIIVISLRLMIGGFSKSSNSKKYVSLSGEDNNSIRISIDTINVIAYKCVSALEGVKEITTKVVSSDDGITVLLNLGLIDGVSIPEKSAEAQAVARDNIVNLTGLTVNGISISIDNAG